MNVDKLGHVAEPAPILVPTGHAQAIPFPSVDMRVLGVIPARGGSKRIPRKNLRLLCGTPLISYTIRAAQYATKLTDLVVSTDDQEIAAIARDMDCEVLDRPSELAAEDATSGAVVAHALEVMQRMYRAYDMVVCLHPTSPIRDPNHIDQAIDMLLASEAPALASVKCDKRTYTHNASIYAMKTSWFTNEHYCDASIPFLMDAKHSLDVNEEIDLKIAELYLHGLH